MKLEEAKVRQQLARHPLYQEHSLSFGEPHVHYLEQDGNIYIGFQTGGNIDRKTHFDIQITGEKAYLLSIEVEEPHRGKGYGFLLYQIIEEIVLDFGCTIIEMTPSGTTVTGESRAGYVRRKLGYTILGLVALKKVTQLLPFPTDASIVDI